MNRPIILLFALALLFAGCMSPRRSADLALRGHWIGTAPDGLKVGYDFRGDGSMQWEVSGQPPISARYEVSRSGDLLAVDIFELNLPQLSRVRFLGLASIEGNEMKFLGVPSMDGRTENGDLATRPQTFGPETIVFTRQSDVKTEPNKKGM
jgi:hypothetical protein